MKKVEASGRFTEECCIAMPTSQLSANAEVISEWSLTAGRDLGAGFDCGEHFIGNIEVGRDVLHIVVIVERFE